MLKKNCRMCKSSNLFEFLDLGFSPPSDDFLTKEQLDCEEVHYPLKVNSCRDCGLVQLNYVVPPHLMFNENYPYESSMTKTGREHFTSMGMEICKRFDLKQDSFVIDIGSNVGVLLASFKSQGMRVLGIEPSANIAKTAIKNGIDTKIAFYSSKLTQEIKQQFGNVSVITGTNVFAHIDDLDDFAKACDTLLTDDGIIVIEAPFLGSMLDNLEYDTIYHEHLSYLSLKPMIKFFKKFGMEVFDITIQSIHGGTCRYYICREGKWKVSDSIAKFLQMEEEQGLYNEERLKKFSYDVRAHKQELTKLLIDLKRQGKKIVGVSAPAKGNTLLNYCKIGPEILDYLTERSLLKIGKYSPGTHIPVYSDEMLMSDNPDYGLILAWNFAKDIIENNKEFMQKGGKFIIPIPIPTIVSNQT